jgi:hypothetical protein
VAKFRDETLGLRVTSLSMDAVLHASAIWGKYQHIYSNSCLTMRHRSPLRQE